MTQEERKQIEETIKEFENNLTGDMINDMAIKEEIHRLNMLLLGVSPNCSMDEGCENCGS